MLNKCMAVRDGMSRLAEQFPHIYYMSGCRIKSMLAERVGTPEPKVFTLADFNRPKLLLEKPTVLYGATEAGKTEFAIAHFDYPLVVRRRDDLKRIAGATDGLIFDDVDFSDWTPEMSIKIGAALCCLTAGSAAKIAVGMARSVVGAPWGRVEMTRRQLRPLSAIIS